MVLFELEVYFQIVKVHEIVFIGQIALRSNRNNETLLIYIVIEVMLMCFSFLQVIRCIDSIKGMLSQFERIPFLYSMNKSMKINLLKIFLLFLRTQTSSTRGK